MPLPGNVNPVDRFQRAAYFRALLPKPKNEREAAAGILAGPVVAWVLSRPRDGNA